MVCYFLKETASIDRSIKQSVEKIRAGAAWLDRSRGPAAEWLKQNIQLWAQATKTGNQRTVYMSYWKHLVKEEEEEKKKKSFCCVFATSSFFFHNILHFWFSNDNHKIIKKSVEQNERLNRL